MGGARCTYGGDVYTRFCWGYVREGDHLKQLSVDWRIIVKWIFRQWNGESWTGLLWLRVVTGRGLLWVRWWTFGFRKMLGISWLAANQLASQEGLCSMKLVNYLVGYTNMFRLRSCLWRRAASVRLLRVPWCNLQYEHTKCDIEEVILTWLTQWYLRNSCKRRKVTVLFNSPRVLEEHCFLKGSQASPVCPFDEDECGASVNWYVTDRGKLKHLDTSLSQCRFVHHKSHMDWLRSNVASAMTGRWITARAMARLYKRQFYLRGVWKSNLYFIENTSSTLLIPCRFFSLRK